MAKKPTAERTYSALFHWKPVVTAVIKVFRHNQSMVLLGEPMARWRGWVLIDEQRQMLYRLVAGTWAELTKRKDYMFPYSVDCVAELYARIKEMDGQLLVQWEKECGT